MKRVVRGIKRCLAGALLAFPLTVTSCHEAESTRLEEQPLPHVRVTAVVKVSPRPKSRHLVLLEPTRRARLSPRMGGQVIDLLIAEQEQVEVGTVLVKFAGQDSKGGLMTAKASISRINEQLRDTKRELSTARELVGRGIETTRAVERLETQQATYQAQLREARGTLLRARDAVGAGALAAPFSGTITRIDTELGEYIGPGAVALVLAQLDPLAAEVPLSEAELAMHDEGGLSFALVVRGERIEPELEWIANEADPDTSTFTARLRVPNDDRSLRAGESAEVEVFGPLRDPVAAVPMTALRWSAGMAYVLRLHGDTVQRIDVRLLDDSDDLITVAGAIEAGDRVVTAGPTSLMPDDEVVVVDPPAETLAAAPG